MMSRANTAASPARGGSRSSARRRSPSVISPVTAAAPVLGAVLGSVTSAQPRPPRVIASAISRRLASRATCGAGGRPSSRSPTRASAAPRRPEGCRREKSSALNPRPCQSAAASASPSASIISADVVGAGMAGSASATGGSRSRHPAACARSEPASLVTAISGRPRRWMNCSTGISSRDWPELDRISTTSPEPMMPRSP